MLGAVIGIILGLIIGYIIPFNISTGYIIYLAVAILSIVDSLIGGIKSDLEDKFDAKIFVFGFLINTIASVFLAYIGDKIGIPLYYAAVFAFGVRLFSNLSSITKIYFKKFSDKNIQKDN